jgi:hypothetical protein
MLDVTDAITSKLGAILLNCPIIRIASLSVLWIKGFLLYVPGPYLVQKSVLKGSDSGTLHLPLLQSQKISLCPTQLPSYEVWFLKHSFLDDRQWTESRHAVLLHVGSVVLCK